MSFTPGPWTCKCVSPSIRNTPGEWDVGTSDFRQLICITRSEADARLIAAAPDLLGTLQILLEGITPDLDSKDCEFMRRIVNTAIAKATGVQS